MDWNAWVKQKPSSSGTRQEHARVAHEVARVDGHDPLAPGAGRRGAMVSARGSIRPALDGVVVGDVPPADPGGDLRAHLVGR